MSDKIKSMLNSTPAEVVVEVEFRVELGKMYIKQK